MGGTFGMAPWLASDDRHMYVCMSGATVHTHYWVGRHDALLGG